MSRYEIHHENKSLAFGNDHACGEYIMIWDTSKYSEPDSDNILVSEDVLFTNLTQERMIKLIEKHGFTKEEITEARGRDCGV